MLIGYSGLPASWVQLVGRGEGRVDRNTSYRWGYAFYITDTIEMCVSFRYRHPYVCLAQACNIGPSILLPRITTGWRKNTRFTRFGLKTMTHGHESTRYAIWFLCKLHLTFVVRYGSRSIVLVASSSKWTTRSGPLKMLDRTKKTETVISQTIGKSMHLMPSFPNIIGWKVCPFQRVNGGPRWLYTRRSNDPYSGLSLQSTILPISLWHLTGKLGHGISKYPTKQMKSAIDSGMASQPSVVVVNKYLWYLLQSVFHWH